MSCATAKVICMVIFQHTFKVRKFCNDNTQNINKLYIPGSHESNECCKNVVIIYLKSNICFLAREFNVENVLWIRTSELVSLIFILPHNNMRINLIYDATKIVAHQKIL